MGTSLEQSARWAGSHHWVESRLFGIVGGWVPTTAPAPAKLLFDRHSQHHAWRAAQWWERLPRLADVDRQALSRPPGPGAETALERLELIETAVGRLAATYRVILPRLWAAYERHRHRVSPLSDGSSLRTLGIVAADVASDWREGEMVVQAQVASGGPAAAAEAAAAVLAVEEILAGEPAEPENGEGGAAFG